MSLSRRTSTAHPRDLYHADRTRQAAVQSFYDEVEWGPGEGDRFEDAARFEDLRPVAADYVRKCHERMSRHLPPSGRYLLDVASGPFQCDAYLN